MNIPHTATIANNGHTVDLTLEDTIMAPQISSGPLPMGHRFAFQACHFHFGKNDTSGSEHTIDGRRYPLEIHCVFRNTKYSTFNEALLHEDGLTVLSRVCEIYDDEMFSPLKPINQAMESTIKPDTSAILQNFIVRDFFQDVMAPEAQVFYSYKGSLTTPPCSEVVYWVVFAVPLKINQSQMEVFRALEKVGGGLIGSNFRALQDLNGRPVYLRSSWFTFTS